MATASARLASVSSQGGGEITRAYAPRTYRLTLFYDLIFFMQDVFDKDVFQNDFMGTVSLTVEEIKEASKVFTLIILKVNSLFEFPTLIRSEVK